MRLEKASYKAIKYACLKFHYAKCLPANPFGFSVFNKENEWCGTIVYGSGATCNIGKPFGLNQGQAIELVRMALNGKQESTSKALSLSIKLIKKYIPLCKLIISYADTEQNHKGIIYMATNWYFIGESKDTNILINGIRKHRRSIGSKYGTSSLEKLKKMGLKVERIYTKPKYKYIYPLNKEMHNFCKSIAKSYPK